MLSSLFSHTHIKGQPFRPYEDQWHGKDWSISPYEDQWTTRWSDAYYADDQLPSLTGAVAGLFSRVRSGLGRA